MRISTGPRCHHLCLALLVCLCHCLSVRLFYLSYLFTMPRGRGKSTRGTARVNPTRRGRRGATSSAPVTATQPAVLPSSNDQNISQMTSDGLLALIRAEFQRLSQVSMGADPHPPSLSVVPHSSSTVSSQSSVSAPTTLPIVSVPAATVPASAALIPTMSQSFSSGALICATHCVSQS